MVLLSCHLKAISVGVFFVGSSKFSLACLLTFLWMQTGCSKSNIKVYTFTLMLTNFFHKKIIAKKSQKFTEAPSPDNFGLFVLLSNNIHHMSY